MVEKRARPACRLTARAEQHPPWRDDSNALCYAVGRDAAALIVPVRQPSSMRTFRPSTKPAFSNPCAEESAWKR